MLNSSTLSASVTPLLMTSACQDRANRAIDPRVAAARPRSDRFNERTSFDEKGIVPTELPADAEHECLDDTDSYFHHTVIHVEVEGDGNVRVWAIEE